jgi:hypothetical protein
VPQRIFSQKENLKLLQKSYPLGLAEEHSVKMREAKNVLEEEKKSIAEQAFQNGVRLIQEICMPCFLSLSDVSLVSAEPTIPPIICRTIEAIAPPPAPSEPPELVLPTDYDEISDYILFLSPRANIVSFGTFLYQGFHRSNTRRRR